VAVPQYGKQHEERTRGPSGDPGPAPDCRTAVIPAQAGIQCLSRRKTLGPRLRGDDDTE